GACSDKPESGNFDRSSNPHAPLSAVFTHSTYRTSERCDPPSPLFLFLPLVCQRARSTPRLWGKKGWDGIGEKGCRLTATRSIQLTAVARNTRMVPFVLRHGSTVPPLRPYRLSCNGWLGLPGLGSLMACCVESQLAIFCQCREDW
ncbi:hypothetical protein CPAR01_11486, partial [Colletotrichum paranaense]